MPRQPPRQRPDYITLSNDYHQTNLFFWPDWCEDGIHFKLSLIAQRRLRRMLCPVPLRLDVPRCPCGAKISLGTTRESHDLACVRSDGRMELWQVVRATRTTKGKA